VVATRCGRSTARPSTKRSAVRAGHGAEFYENIGQKGGNAVKDKYGPGFYEEIGHKGGQKVKRLIEEAKRSER